MNSDTSPTDIGRNRTGIGIAPLRARAMDEAASQVTPTGNPAEFDTLRTELSRSAPPVGTVPPPVTLKGMTKTAAKIIQGRNSSTFVDKLAERLAFERTGVRLYQAVLAMLSASDISEGTLTPEAVRHIKEEEHQHVAVVREALEELGADPTAQTPCADLAGVQGQGLMQSISDPRTTLTQRLSSLLTAELTDNDGWALLIEMADSMGLTEMSERFDHALEQEEDHLKSVRIWLRERVNKQLVGRAEAAAQPEQPQA